LIVEGKANATKKDGSGREDVVYQYSNSGDYFGELALMGDQKPRQANVVATVDFV
jgi:CRP-like cAMP-binding protein